MILSFVLHFLEGVKCVFIGTQGCAIIIVIVVSSLPANSYRYRGHSEEDESNES